jgi:ATP:ADP antiporter, AAA family
VIVVSYNLVINLFEVVWKDQLKHLYPNISDYNNYISHLQVLQGVSAIILSLGLAQLMRFFGWTKTALITPVVMMVSCFIFFGLIFSKEALSPYFLPFLGVGPLMISISFGSFQSFMSKACKYSVFDSTKEMAYLPLDPESKLRSKVAIDGIGARLGKSGSSLLHQILLILFSTISNCAPYIGIILLIVGILWIISVSNLGKQLKNFQKKEPTQCAVGSVD